MIEGLPREAFGVLGFAGLLALIFLRVPVAIAMASVGLIGCTLLTSLKPTGLTFAAAALESIFPYTLSVIPLFVLMGVFITHADLSRKLYEGMHALVRHRPGGLAQSTVGACALFGAIRGSSLATAATMTRVALPEMQKRGYDDGLATGAIAAGGTLGILILPSIILMIYGILTGTSIGKLFVAGIVPVWFGILLVSATEIGLITPPVGMNLFIIKGLASDIDMRRIWSGVTPFIIADLLRLAVLIAFPVLTLFLPAALR